MLIGVAHQPDHSVRLRKEKELRSRARHRRYGPSREAPGERIGAPDWHRPTLQTAPCVVEVRNAGRKILDSRSPFVILCHQFLETKERRRIHNADDAIHMHHIVRWNVIAVLAKNRQLPN